MARYKLPTMLRVVKELPKTAVGKVLKTALRKEFVAGKTYENLQIWRNVTAPAIAARL